MFIMEYGQTHFIYGLLFEKNRIILYLQSIKWYMHVRISEGLLIYSPITFWDIIIRR